MSYCRFSSANWQSDVYVYHDISDRWVIHVAGRRLMFKHPLPEPSWTLAVKYPRLWVIWHRVHMFVLGLIPRVDIKLPDAGKTFYSATPGDCAGTLDYLRAGGFYVPHCAIEELDEEQRELDKMDRIERQIRRDAEKTDTDEAAAGRRT